MRSGCERESGIYVQEWKWFGRLTHDDVLEICPLRIIHYAGNNLVNTYVVLQSHAFFWERHAIRFLYAVSVLCTTTNTHSPLRIPKKALEYISIYRNNEYLGKPYLDSFIIS